ncbi:MAG: ATP-binding protein [Eubacterium sp.]|nr:ATP-binding protein [Eubacterium sp.]
MNNKAAELDNIISSLAVFAALKEDPAIDSLRDFLEADDGETAEQLDYLSDFASELYQSGGDLPAYIRQIVMEDENAFLLARAKSLPVTEQMAKTAEHELDALQVLAAFSPEDAARMMGYSGYVPGWSAAGSTEGKKESGEGFDLKNEYFRMLDDIPTKGYGVFAKYYAFKIEDGELVPVKHADPQSLDTLYGYEYERGQVLNNTRVLAEGGHAANVLLYGDAGTGKSSTIKACANEFRDQGVRLIEFDKDQISEIPAIIDQVYDTPLKYIFYIDDLSFNSEDDDFCYLKGILEGNITGKSDNIVIYATSNRRHLVRELAEDRSGTDIHVNDTLQQTMSLSARFGITVTFQKPQKDLYLNIVKHLAEDEKIDLPEEELFRQAERFAIRSNGRSPRTAKQFVQLLKIEAAGVTEPETEPPYEEDW